MKHLFESWRNHLNEAPIEQYDMLRKWMVENPDSYSFDNLFGGKISEGGKYRIPIPVTTGATSGPIGEIVRFFEDNGWEIDFRKGKVTKTSMPDFKFRTIKMQDLARNTKFLNLKSSQNAKH